MGQLLQSPTLNGCAWGLTHDANEDLAQGFRADMAMASQLGDWQRPGEMLFKQAGRFS